MKHYFATLALALGLSACTNSEITSQPGEIGNASLVLRYDDANDRFSLAERGSGKIVVKNGQLDGADKILRQEEVKDPIFGTGHHILLSRHGGGEISLELYPGLPFLLVRESLRNGSAAQIDLDKVVPASFSLDLGKPAAELVTLGTGGLLPADKNPGSHLFLTAADPSSRHGVVAGWLTQDRGSGVMFSSVKDGGVDFKAQIDYGHLRIPAGHSAQLETLAIGAFADARLGQEAWADAVKKQYAIKLRKPDAVYCTWYADGAGHGGAGNEKNTVELSKFIAKELKPYGLSVLQIDDMWQDGPAINGPRRGFDRVRPNGPYAHGIAPVAQEVAKDGLGFGLWWIPFGRNYQDPAWKDRQDWFTKGLDGKPFDTDWGGTCLDLTHPKVQEHLAELVKLYRDWGVTYFKMDAAWTGTSTKQIYVNDGYKDDNMSAVLPFHDPLKTQIEAYRDGWKLLRKNAGDKIFFSGCCLSQNMRSINCVGLVDAMRVGPDAGGDLMTGPLRGSRLYFMNGRLWWNDPDPAKVRTSVEDNGMGGGGVSLDQARMISSWVAVSGQFFLVSDWLPSLPPERLEVLKRTMAHQDGSARPVDTFDRDMPNTWLLGDDKSGVKRQVIGVFNFDGAPLQVIYSLAKLGLDASKSYHAFDFWADKPLPDVEDSFSSSLVPGSCQVVSVREVEAHPVLISTSRHVSSGILEVENETWKGSTLSGTSSVIGKDSYELRICGLRDGNAWTPAAVSLSADDLAAGVTVSHSLEAGLLRVKIVSPVSRSVKWSVRFDSSALKPEMAQNFKAAASGPYEPVVLTWESEAPFHTLSRDGQVIAQGHYGQSYRDDGASRGASHVYTLAIDGQAALPAITVVVPALPPPPPLPRIKLEELPTLIAENGWLKMQVGKAIDGSVLAVAGKPCTSGLGLHAPAHYAYARPAAARRFVAHLGLNNSQRDVGATSVRCQVVAEAADGSRETLLATPLLRFGCIESFSVDLALPATCVKLHLITDDGGDGIRCDHINWGDAGFITE